MKRLVYFLMLLFMMLSCTLDHETARRMQHDLQRVQEMNKAFIPLDTVTVMDTVLDYYESHGSRTDKMMANYMMGCVHRDRGNSPIALAYYRKATEYADTTEIEEVKTLSRIYGQIAYIFNQQHSPQYQIGAERKAIYYAWKAKDTLSALRFHEFIAIAYYFKGEKDSAIWYINKTSDLYLQLLGRKDLAIRPQTIAVQIYLERQDYEKAGSLLSDFDKYSGLLDTKGNIATGCELYYYYKGKYYEGIHKYDSARIYYMKLLPFRDNTNLMEAACKGLCSLYSITGPADSISKYAKLYCEANDTSNLKTSSEEIIRMQALYDYSEIQRLADEKTIEAENYKTMSTLLLAIISFSLYSIYVYIRNQRKKVKEESIKANIKYDNLLSQYQHTMQDMDLLQNGYEQFKNEKQKELENLQKELAVYHDDGFVPEIWDMEQAILESDTIKRMRQFARKGRMPSDKEKEHLREYAKSVFPDFYQFITHQRILTEKEIDVCILMKFRFIPTEIATILDLTKQRVSNIRNSINWKLFKSKGTKSLDTNIRRI